MANFISFPASERGHANHGWLNTYHEFSFADYYNPDRMGFGALRVLNDDYVQPAMGFGTHSHSNMEIVTIPLIGELEHRDSMNNTQILHPGEIQVMSAGTGLFHSEYNPSTQVPANFLQIWIIPNKQNVEPRYVEANFNVEDRINKFQLIVSPHKKEKTWINQDAFLSLANITDKTAINYRLHKPQNNGVFIFLVEGAVKAEGVNLKRRDAVGYWNVDTILLEAEENSFVLVVEVPLLDR